MPDAFMKRLAFRHQRAADDVYVTGALETGESAVVGGIRIATEGMLVRTEAGGGS